MPPTQPIDESHPRGGKLIALVAASTPAGSNDQAKGRQARSREANELAACEILAINPLIGTDAWGLFHCFARTWEPTGEGVSFPLLPSSPVARGLPTNSSSQKAVELNPSFAYGHSVHGSALAFAGRGAEGLEDIALAMKLSPRNVWFEEFDLHCAFAHFQVGNYEEAARFAERASLPRPGHVTPHWLLMASYGHSGEMKKGQDALFRLSSSIPGFLLAAENIPPVYVQDEDHHRVLDGLDRAGVLGV